MWMASKPILFDRLLLQLQLPLLLFLTAREFILTLSPAVCCPLGCAFILHPQVCHINVLRSTIALSVEDVFGGLRINGQHWLNNDTIPFDSAQSSVSALPLAMICCLRVNAVSGVVTSSTIIPSLNICPFVYHVSSI